MNRFYSAPFLSSLVEDPDNKAPLRLLRSKMERAMPHRVELSHRDAAVPFQQNMWMVLVFWDFSVGQQSPVHHHQLHAIRPTFCTTTCSSLAIAVLSAQNPWSRWCYKLRDLFEKRGCHTGGCPGYLLMHAASLKMDALL